MKRAVRDGIFGRASGPPILGDQGGSKHSHSPSSALCLGRADEAADSADGVAFFPSVACPTEDTSMPRARITLYVEFTREKLEPATLI